MQTPLTSLPGELLKGAGAALQHQFKHETNKEPDTNTAQACIVLAACSLQPAACSLQRAGSLEATAVAVKPVIFISHAGADGEILAHQLNSGFNCRGYATFVDWAGVKAGQSWQLQIKQAAQTCQVFLAVLTPAYWTRRWCLLELMLATKAKQAGAPITIIPLYFQLDVGQVQEPPQDVIAEWEKLEQANAGREADEQVRAAELKHLFLDLKSPQGIIAPTSKGKLDAYLDTIIEAVSRTNVPRLYEHYSEGMVARQRLVQWLVYELSNTIFLGVHGMGGTGKSTLAKAVCHAYINDEGCKHRDGRTCILDFDLKDEQDNVKLLKQALVELGYERQQVVDDLKDDQMRSKLKKILKDHPCMLVLDNVSSGTAGEFILGQWAASDKLHAHTRVLIFGRLKDKLCTICSAARSMACVADKVVEMPVLTSAEAVELFCNHAQLPTQRAEQSSEQQQLLAAAMELLNFGKSGSQYHPLSIKAVGSAVRNLTASNANAVFDAYRQGLDAAGNDGVLTVLRKSYDILSPDLQHMFLDIALAVPQAVRVHEDVVQWCQWVSDAQETNMRGRLLVDQLAAASLISVVTVPEAQLGDIFQWRLHEVEHVTAGNASMVDHGTKVVRVVTVHDLYLELAEQLANEPKLQQRRFLRYVHNNNGAAPCLMEPKELCKFVADGTNATRIILTGSKFSSFKSSRLEQYPNIQVVHMVNNELGEVKAFNWGNVCSIDLSHNRHLSSLPAQLQWCTSSLLYLSLRGCSSLASLPDTITACDQLAALDLGDCVSLVRLPAQLSLPSLRVLNLTCCIGLAVVPELQWLPALEQLLLQGCIWIKDLGDMSALSQLKVLSLDNCVSLCALPPSLAQCTNLHFLDISNCVYIRQAPTHLTSLRCLNLTRSPCKLAGISNLRNLRFLNLDWWSGAENKQLPLEITSLTQLTGLSIVPGPSDGCLAIDESCETTLKSMTGLKQLSAPPPGQQFESPMLKAKQAPLLLSGFEYACSTSRRSTGIPSMLQLCERELLQEAPDLDRLEAVTYTLQAIVDSDKPRNVFLDKNGAQTVSRLAMDTRMNGRIQNNACVTLCNVCVSFPSKVLQGLDLDTYLLKQVRDAQSGNCEHRCEATKRVLGAVLGWSCSKEHYDEHNDVLASLRAYVQKDDMSRLCSCALQLLSKY